MTPTEQVGMFQRLHARLNARRDALVRLTLARDFEAAWDHADQIQLYVKLIEDLGAYFKATPMATREETEVFLTQWGKMQADQIRVECDTPEKPPTNAWEKILQDDHLP